MIREKTSENKADFPVLKKNENENGVTGVTSICAKKNV